MGDRTNAKMNKPEIRKLVVLIVIAIGTTITAIEAVRIARNGFSIELSIEEAQTVADEVNKALDARQDAEEDMEGEL